MLIPQVLLDCDIIVQYIITERDLVWYHQRKPVFHNKLPATITMITRISWFVEWVIIPHSCSGVFSCLSFTSKCATCVLHVWCSTIYIHMWCFYACNYRSVVHVSLEFCCEFWKCQILCIIFLMFILRCWQSCLGNGPWVKR